VQWEQHQPVKSSPSIQIKRLFIHHHLSLFVRSGFGLGRGGRNTTTDRARKVNSCPPQSIFHGFAIGQSN
jgi:hypothetical protein